MLKHLNILYILTLLVISFTFNIYYGSIGVFPIDTFAFFDSANLINQGFLPIRDYWTSNGLLVDFIQSLFFKIFGVSWLIYLFHSSIVNFIFALFTFKFLNHVGLNSKFSFFYSFAVCILAYPPVGVPFSDHHSLIFSIISIYTLILTLQKESNFYLFTTIFILFVAFLCKQIPAAFFILLTSTYLFYFSIKKKNYSLIINSLIFSLSLILIFFLFLKISSIPIKDFFIQYINFPLSIGDVRTANFTFLNFTVSLINEFKFFLIIILIMIFQILKEKKFNLLDTNIVFILVTFLALLNQELMKNQNIVFFILPILTGLVHLRLNKKSNQYNFFYLIFIIIFCVFITTKYHLRFNVDRKFMDLQSIDKTNTINAEIISKKLKGLKWITSIGQIEIDNEVLLLKESIAYLKSNKKNSMVISNYQFLNSEIDNRVYSPNRWYTNDGVSYPLSENKYFEYYVYFFKKQLIKNKIIKIYTLYPLNEKSFKLVLQEGCIITKKINNLLEEHNLTNCF